MFSIDPIIQDYHHYDEECHFPKIDFKFQNTGTATALLWRFSVNVLEVQIDTTPILSFEAGTDEGKLQISAINNGWGVAHDCKIKISESESVYYSGTDLKKISTPPFINDLFAESIRQYTGTLQGGEKKEIFRLSKDHADANRMAAAFRERGKSINLGPLKAHWDCKDSEGHKHQNISSVHLLGPAFESNNIVFTRDGFSLESHTVLHMLLPGDVIYVALLDPSKGAYEQPYPISRKIPSGDVDRFHIMIGSPMSCHLILQFKFYIDQATIVQSEIFDIKIWNPRNSEWNTNNWLQRRYKDGAEILREKEQIRQQNPDSARIRLDQLEGKSGTFPFFDN